MQTPSDQTLWNVLLELRRLNKSKMVDWENLSIQFRENDFLVLFDAYSYENESTNEILISHKHVENIIPNTAHFVIEPDNSISIQSNSLITSQQANFFALYLPFCILAAKAHQHKKAITVLHLAQSLDGKIATNTGHSQWISNPENLIHSHRMRALCDAILIGANTLRTDKPTLTVRHVNGPNPVKVVLGSNHCSFESLMQDDGKVIFFSTLPESYVNGMERVYVETSNQRISTTYLLEELYNRGIYSIYIEGGASTASQFMAEKSVNYLQLFVAPRLFGSGIQNFALPGIQEVDESVSFAHTSFQPMGNGILFNATL